MLFGTPFIIKYIIPISLGGRLYGDEFISTVWVTKKYKQSNKSNTFRVFENIWQIT